jgi:hypothetical protein
VDYRHNWGEDRVYFLDANGLLVSLPASWTSAVPEDPFVAIAAGRSHFRYQDLIELVKLTEGLSRPLGNRSVKEMTPRL